MKAEKPVAATTATPTIVPKRWPFRVLAGFLFLLALVWSAPIVVGWTPAASWACGYARDHIDGSVTVGGVSLGWFSSIVLHNVELRDADNRLVLHAQKIETERTLLGLLLDREDLGTVRLEKPKLEWNFAGNSSNLERVLAKSIRPPDDGRVAPTDGKRSLPPIHLEIVDGVVTIYDDDTKLFWKAHSLAFSAIVFNDPAQTVQVNLQGSLHDGSEGGSIKVEAQIQNALSDEPKATIKGRFSSFPLAAANLLLRRHHPNTTLGGSLHGHCMLSASLQSGRPLVDLVGELTGNHITLNSPVLDDQLFLERISAPCRLALNHDKLTIERAEIVTDFGKCNLQGTIDLAADGLAAVDRPDFELGVDVNLAVLAARLPKTLRLQQNLRLTTGQVSLACKSTGTAENIVWKGNMHASEIRGIKGGQTISWPEPIRLDFQARNLSKGVPLIDELKCTARFLKLNATTTPNQFTLTADADLQQLVEPLSRFVELDALKLTGRATAAVIVRRDPARAERFVMQGNAGLKQINLTWLTRQPWQEDSVSTKFGAIGQLHHDGRQLIESADFEATLGNDLLTANLKEPVPDLAAGPWGSLAIRVQGDLARWQQRARGWTTLLDDWLIEGQGGFALQVRPARDGIDCTSANLQVTNLRCIGASLWVFEPQFTVSSSGRWDARTNRIHLQATKVTCPSAQIDLDRLSLDPATMALDGNATLTGDIARLRRWTLNPRAKTPEPLNGTVALRGGVQSTGAGVLATFTGSIKNLIVGPTANPTWREAEVQCTGQGSYDLASDAFRLDRLSVIGATLSADLSGKIDQVTATTDVLLDGSLRYDLEKMEPQLRPFLGKDVKIVGKDARPIRVAGPLYPKSKTAARKSTEGMGPAPLEADLATLRFTELKGQGGIHWNSLKAYGCDVGPADVKAVMQQGWIQLYPIETSINGGKLRLQPNLRLDPDPVEMVLLAGPVIEKAAITPEMCAGGLGYVMPVLANVASAEGTISLSLEGGRIPLGQPTSSEVKGTFVLHAARVGPSPILRELSTLLRMPPPTSLAKECSVPFHMINGKIHHRDMELAFPEFTLKSSGVVGLDGTLAIVVEMPLPASLIAGARLTPAQAKQMLRIPIGGTLSQPRPDPRALESLGAILGRSILENQLNNQLNRFLQPKR